TSSELRSYMRERVPGYMVPSRYVRLEEIPRQSNGKVDRKELARKGIGEGVMEGEEGYVEPRGEVEEVVAGIWRGVLGVERVGAQDNFFEIGGHSLLATRVISRLKEAFKLELAVRWLFEKPTVRGQAEDIERMLKEGGVAVKPIERVDRGGELSLSFAQQR